MIHLSKVTKLNAGKTALREATMVVPKGSYAILKVDSELAGTLLLRLLTGYERPERGTVRVNEIDVTRLSQERVPFLRRNIGWMEFKPNLAGNRTVLENLAMPLQIAGFNRKALRERITDKLEEASLTSVANVLVQQLDTSDRRLLACARATIHNPQTILADCPESQVSESNRELIFSMLETANANGATVLVITDNTIPVRGFTHAMHTNKGSIIQNKSTTGRLIKG